MRIILSPFRNGVYSIVLQMPSGKHYFNFPTLSQAQNALAKIKARKYKDLCESLKRLCGDDYYSHELESFQFKGTQPSSMS